MQIGSESNGLAFSLCLSVPGAVVVKAVLLGSFRIILKLLNNAEIKSRIFFSSFRGMRGGGRKSNFSLCIRIYILIFFSLIINFIYNGEIFTFSILLFFPLINIKNMMRKHGCVKFQTALSVS